MNKRSRRNRTRNILTLTVSTVITAYYIMGTSLNQFLPSQKQPINKKNTAPNNSSTGLVIRSFNEAGQIDYTMTASQADLFSIAKNKSSEHIFDGRLLDDFAETNHKKDTQNQRNHQNKNTPPAHLKQEYLQMLNPSITIYENNHASTILAANLAHINDKGNTAKLIGNVQVNDIKTASQLQTHSLTLNTALKQILTHNSVVIQTPSSKTHAKGLQGNLIDRRWHLLSEVKSVIQP